MHISRPTQKSAARLDRRAFLRGAAATAAVAGLAGCTPVRAGMTRSAPLPAAAVPLVDDDLVRAYAELLIRTGVNLQPHQGLWLNAQLGHAPFVRELVAGAYQAGASYVYVDWGDAPSTAAMLANAELEQIEVPAFEQERIRYMVDNGWGFLSLTGTEFPNALDAIDPARIGAWSVRRRNVMEPLYEVVQTNRAQWCVGAVPTPAWAQQVFPGQPAAAAVAALWETVLHIVRADLPDPAAAWQTLDRRLKGICAFLHDNAVRSLHFLDPAPGPDGRPATDLVVELVENALWAGGASVTPGGVAFFANIPTEEVFSMPNNQRTHGYTRTSRPIFLLGQEVRDAWFRFEAGAMVEFTAAVGADVLAEFFTIDGARRLGEVALVDANSPIFQSGLVFHDVLYDENAACHIAFGSSYPETVAGGVTMEKEELAARGANQSDTHEDFMIGTPTMNITGLCADGREVAILEAGRFAAAVLA